MVPALRSECFSLRKNGTCALHQISRVRYVTVPALRSEPFLIRRTETSDHTNLSMSLFPLIRCIDNRASHVQLFWIFMLFQAVKTVKLNFKAGLFSSTFQFEHSFLAKSQC